MSLNFFTLASSLLIGLTAGAAAAHALRTGGSAPSAALRGLLVGIAGSVIACLGALVIAKPDYFALVHVLYLVVVVSIPLASAIVLYAATPVPTPLAVMLCLLLFLLPIGVYTTRVEPFWLRVERVTLTNANVSSPIRIGVLSDLQTTEIGAYENSAIDALLAAEPDLILIPGDFWQLPGDDFDDEWPQFAGAMKRLGDGAPHVYVVKGNTDWVDGLQKITEGTNVEVLDNRIVELEYGTTTIQLGGITLLGGDEFGAGRTARQLMSPVGPDLRIALAHNPDEIERFEESPVDLLVVGHTHGGQVSIPFFGPPVTLTGVPRSVAAGGLHELDGTPIYVSTGVGRERGNAPQIRFGVRPSIGIIDIVPE